MRSRVLAAVLVFLMMPASAELIEAAAHLVAHGDVGHLAIDGEAAPRHDEHGCSALLHHCGCHAGTSLPHVTLARDVDRQAHALARGPAPDEQRGRGAPPPALRPPIA
jgi:hypothetical protein